MGGEQSRKEPFEQLENSIRNIYIWDLNKLKPLISQAHWHSYSGGLLKRRLCIGLLDRAVVFPLPLYRYSRWHVVFRLRNQKKPPHPSPGTLGEQNRFSASLHRLSLIPLVVTFNDVVIPTPHIAFAKTLSNHHGLVKESLPPIGIGELYKRRCERPL